MNNTAELNNLSTDQLKALLAEREAEENKRKNEARNRYEELKKDTILKLVPMAKGLSDQLKAFKALAFDEMDTLYDLLCEYSKRHADGKGNFKVEITEGLRINYRKQDVGFFDERSVQAEKHILDFVKVRFAKDAEAQEAITTLLERKKDSLDIKMVQKLYSMETKFDDPNWKEGIKLLKESWTPSETKSYIVFEVKVEGEWHSINLNFASV